MKPIICPRTFTQNKIQWRDCYRKESVVLWFKTAINRDVSTGPLARPFARSLAPLTHSLTFSLHTLLRSWEKEWLDGYFFRVFFLFWTIVQLWLSRFQSVPNDSGKKRSRRQPVLGFPKNQSINRYQPFSSVTKFGFSIGAKSQSVDKRKKWELRSVW